MYVCIERNDCTHWALIHYKFDELLIYHLGLETLALISLTLLVYCTVSGQVTLLDRDDEDEVVGSHEASYELVFVEKIVRDGQFVTYILTTTTTTTTTTFLLF